MNTILFVLRTGCQWQALDATGICKHSSAHRRFQEWVQAGVFEQFWMAGLMLYDELKGIDWTWLSMYGAMTKAPLGVEKNRAESHRPRQARGQAQSALLFFPPLRSGWAQRGQSAKVMLSRGNARWTIFGALHLRDDRMLRLEQRGRKAEDFQEFLDFTHWYYRHGPPVAMLLDENSIHTAKGSQSPTEDLGIQLLRLPKRSPHLNPMDHLWGHGKRVVCPNVQLISIQAKSTPSWTTTTPSHPKNS